MKKISAWSADGRRLRRWRWTVGIIAAGLAAAPFVAMHVLARVFLGCDAPLPGTTRVDLRLAAGTGLASYWRYAEHPRVTMIFVHGTPASAGAFRRQMVGPFPDADLAVYDRPGFGCSQGSGRALANLRAQADALRELIGLARTPLVVLVGHSYGAPVALLAAVQMPGRVAGVVTVGGSVSPSEEHPWTTQRFGAWPPVAALLPGVVRATNQELLGLKADLLFLDTQLPALRCPVLMLQGDRDEQVPARNVPYLEARFAALGKSSRLQTRLFPGYNHFMLWEHPAEVNAALADFLARIVPAD